MTNHTDPVQNRSRNPAATTKTAAAAATVGATTAVGQFYRQFSKKKKKSKDKQQQQQQDVTAAAASPPLSSSAPVDQPQSTRTARKDSLCVRPALEAVVVHAPPWLVADHFVSEHVVHEHLSVVPEPDYADPVTVTPDDDAPVPSPTSPPHDPTTAVEHRHPVVPSSSSRVSIRVFRAAFP